MNLQQFDFFKFMFLFKRAKAVGEVLWGQCPETSIGFIVHKPFIKNVLENLLQWISFSVLFTSLFLN